MFCKILPASSALFKASEKKWFSVSITAAPWAVFFLAFWIAVIRSSLDNGLIVHQGTLLPFCASRHTAPF